jgi:hypothetical protein
MDLMKAHKTYGGQGGVQWTLADWLAQKNRMALMDQWLALHRSSGWFEADLGGTQGRYGLVSVDAEGAAAKVSHDRITSELNLNALIFNLHGEYERTGANEQAYGGAAGIRLLGTTPQTTSLLARYGWRRFHNQTTAEHWDNLYAEGELQLYIFRWLGLKGNYRHYFPATSNFGQRLAGHRATGEVFFEFSIFRLFADYWVEPVTLTSSEGSSVSQTREGYQGGLRLFF